jgi:tetratricopeptide (TPR) repeat protein
MRPQTSAESSPAGGGPSTKAPPVLRAIPSVPDYGLLRRIGGGAYGEVWLARSVATGALRAAKIVWRHTFEDERPFRREFEGIQRFERISREHPSQLALFHIGRNEAEGYFYYVMELADGVEVQSPKSEVLSQPKQDPPTLDSYAPHTLRADLEKGRLPAARALEIGLALAEALSHLHQHGLVHRDVKPSNVIFVNGRPKLADIGLVTDVSDQCSIVGTEGYLPPEGPGTPQADIFALGKVLYEAATGLDRREFPKLPEEMRVWSDAKSVFELNEIVLAACASVPHSRYSSVETLLADLQRLQGGKSVKRIRALQRYWTTAKRAAIPVAGLAAVTALLAFLWRGTAPSDPFPEGRPSANLVANGDCDKGMAIIRLDNYAQLAQAYAYFTNAIALDPQFARPYIGLLEMALRDQGAVLTPAAAVEMRRQAAASLKALAPGLSATYVAQSINSYYDWDYPAAERYAIQGIKANPSYELGHTWYGFMLSHWGRLAEARAQNDISLRLAPTKAIVYRCIGHTYYAQRDFTNAVIWYKKAIALDVHHREDFFWLGKAQRAMGDYEPSIDTQEQGDLLYAKNESSVRQHYDGLRQAFKIGGPRGFWEEAWKDSEANPKDLYLKAYIQIHLGETNAALGWLEEAFAAQQGRGNEGPLGYLLFDESWDGLRSNARFDALLSKIGYTKVTPPRK